MRVLYTLMIALAVTLATAMPVGALGGSCKGVPYDPYLDLIQTISDRFKVPQEQVRKVIYTALDEAAERGFPQLEDILAVIGVESSWQTGAYHPAGPSVGLMMVNAKYVKGVKLREPVPNIREGVKILKEYRARSRSDVHALTAYNAGPGGASKICKAKKFCKSTYSDKVMAERARIVVQLPRA